MTNEETRRTKENRRLKSEKEYRVSLVAAIIPHRRMGFLGCQTAGSRRSAKRSLQSVLASAIRTKAPTSRRGRERLRGHKGPLPPMSGPHRQLRGTSLPNPEKWLHPTRHDRDSHDCERSSLRDSF